MLVASGVSADSALGRSLELARKPPTNTFQSLVWRSDWVVLQLIAVGADYNVRLL